MTRTPHAICCFFLVLFATGCSSVPRVENHLQSLQFYPNMYVVQAGETLDTIAFRYQLDRNELAALNPGSENGVIPGMRLNVRPGTNLNEGIRAGSGYALVEQPIIVPANSAAQQVAIAQTGSPAVVVSPVADAPATGFPREEIVPDDHDFQPVQQGSDTLSRELQPFLGAWSWPMQGHVARGFAPDEVGGQGVDIAGVPGQEVRAAMQGTVVYSGRDLSGGGKLIIVQHDDSLMTTYSHADELFVVEDDVVQAGDPIASLGWNANQESVLRFEVRRDGNPLNPLDFLPAK